MIKCGRFEITQECGCYCLYRLIRNASGDVIKKVMVLNTAELEKAIIKLVGQLKQQKECK